MNLDNYFGIHAKALSLRDQRSTQLAMNITNANTPNYKAQDMDFNAVLKNSMKDGVTIQKNAPNHMDVNTMDNVAMEKRKASHVSLDGNTVDKDLETIEFSRNSFHYQASLTFLDGKIKSMMLALRGE